MLHNALLRKRMLRRALLIAMICLSALCVKAANAEETHLHNGKPFLPWNDAAAAAMYGEGAHASTCLPNPSGGSAAGIFYYLTDDVTVSSTTQISCRKLHLCLNGHTITCTSDVPVFLCSSEDLPERGAVSLYDEGNGGEITYADGVDLTCAMIECTSVYSGFSMYGGRLHGKGAVGVLAASEASTFDIFSSDSRMTGGEMTGFKTAVVLQGYGAFTMDGGQIDGNNQNGTVGVSLDGNGSFIINGGVIRNCGTGAVILNTYGDKTVTATGGRITACGCGIDANNFCTLNVSGNPDISENSVNVRLGGSTLITLTGRLADAVRIGVTLSQAPGIFTSGLNGNGTPANFTSDDGTYGVALSGDGEAMLSQTLHVSYDGNGATSGTVPTDQNSPYPTGGNVVVLGNTGNLAFDGYSFAGWNTTPDGSGDALSEGESFDIHSDTTLYAMWKLTRADKDFYVWTDTAAAWRYGEGVTAAGGLPTAPGSYALLRDAALTSTWNAPGGATDLNLDGHGITLNQAGQVIVVSDGATLSLYDSGNAEHRYRVDGNRRAVLDEQGTRSFAGGYITHKGFNGSGVWVKNATFNLYGGTIIGNLTNTSESGGGVRVSSSGTFNLYGGAIIGNIAPSGGGVFNAGTFTMSGGVISGNDVTGYPSGPKNGGGVFNDSTCTISGGRITGNGARFGGGVYSGKHFTLSGGTITGNNASYGGGIYTTKSAEATNATFCLSGNPLIQDNTTGAGDDVRPGNVFLSNGCSVITIIGTLNPSEPIGVGTNVTPTDPNPLKITSGLPGHGTIQCFTSEMGEEFISSSGEAALSVYTISTCISPDDSYSPNWLGTSSPFRIAGMPVSMTIDPYYDGYVLTQLSYTTKGGSETAIPYTAEYEEDGEEMIISQYTASFPMPASNVTVTAVFAQMYTVRVLSYEGGRATLADGRTTGSFLAEGKVALTVTPDSGYVTDVVIGHPAMNQLFFIGADNAFDMPEANVTVAAVFQPVPGAVAPPDFTLSANVKSIGANAFEGIPATSVQIPAGCLSIGEKAFANCDRLTQIHIPASVTDIAGSAFDDCDNAVYVYGAPGSAAEAFCRNHSGRVFIGGE